MKHIIALLLVLASICCANPRLYFFNLSSHRGDVWTIRSLGSVDGYKIAHGHLKTNSMTIKWNIKKGRLSVMCDSLCNENDEFLIRLFDKDTLRIDFIAYDIKPNVYRSGDEYIVPSDIKNDIAFMEIMPLNEDWLPKYEVICNDGYIPDVLSCVKDATNKNDCPPSWKDNNGRCDPRWYSDISE